MITRYFMRRFIAVRQFNQGFNYWLEVGSKHHIHSTVLDTVLGGIDHHAVNLPSSGLAKKIFADLEINGARGVDEVRLERGDGERIVYFAHPSVGTGTEPPSLVAG